MYLGMKSIVQFLFFNIHFWSVACTYREREREREKERESKAYIQKDFKLVILLVLLQNYNYVEISLTQKYARSEIRTI